MTDPVKPHKWAKEIKAWADGAEIEYRFKQISGKWSEWEVSNADSDNTVYWVFDGTFEYRVKPVRHKHQDLIDAYNAGATDIQIFVGSGWHDLDPKAGGTFREDAELRRKHKWQKEMDAYAAGKEIQLYSPIKGWVDCDWVPQWKTHCEYRIKPEVVERHGVAFMGESWLVERRNIGEKKNNIKLTFEDGKLIKAEVIG